MLETTWFVLWGLLWAIYFMLDGFDLGIGALMPFIARNEEDRRSLYRAIGPFWDGNEVWLITAAGVTFAAFPGTYAVMFSALYSPLMVILFALILRGAAVGFRSEVESHAAKRLCDALFFLGSVVPAVLFGVAFANIFKGIPIDGNGVFVGTIVDLLNPYGMLGGMLSLAAFLVHGALWLAIKTTGPLQKRMADFVQRAWLGLYAALGIFMFLFVLSRGQTALGRGYIGKPTLFWLPVLALISLFCIFVFVRKRGWARAWTASSVFLGLALFSGVLGIYPALLPSSLAPAFSMTIYNSASSPLTLKIMLCVALVLVPVVIIYQAWTFHLFRGKADGPDAVGKDVY
jgi:cytochrome d ubiquinol oxidase subunit II